MLTFFIQIRSTDFVTCNLMSTLSSLLSLAVGVSHVTVTVSSSAYTVASISSGQVSNTGAPVSMCEKRMEIFFSVSHIVMDLTCKHHQSII